MWTDDWKPALDARFSATVEPMERIKGYLESPYERQCKIKQNTGKVLGCPVCSVGSEISTQEVDVLAKVREIVSRRRKYLESAIRDAVAEGMVEPCDPVQKSVAIQCLMEGAISQARIMNDAEPLRNLAAMAFDILRVKYPPSTSSKAMPAATS